VLPHFASTPAACGFSPLLRTSTLAPWGHAAQSLGSPMAPPRQACQRRHHCRKRRRFTTPSSILQSCQSVSCALEVRAGCLRNPKPVPRNESVQSAVRAAPCTYSLRARGGAWPPLQKRGPFVLQPRPSNKKAAYVSVSTSKSPPTPIGRAEAHPRFPLTGTAVPDAAVWLSAEPQRWLSSWAG